MPIAYYSMPFCKPPEGVRRATSTINPGTILLGIRIENSPYNFTIMVRTALPQPWRMAGTVAEPCSCLSRGRLLRALLGLGAMQRCTLGTADAATCQAAT